MTGPFSNLLSNGWLVVSKVARKAVHEYVKRELADTLSGDTVDDPQVLPLTS